MLFRTRALFVRQRTQTVNALRGHLAEFGLVSARGVANAAALRAELEKAAEGIPELVRRSAEMLFERIGELSGRIAELDREIRRRSRERRDIQNLMTIPGVGPLCAMAVHAFAPPMESFRRGRDFAAWTGLTPRQHSTAGRQRLGRITKMGQRDIRSHLVLGAVAVLRHQRGREEIQDPWLRRMAGEKPFKVAAVALANKMARIVWALSVRSETYRAMTRRPDGRPESRRKRNKERIRDRRRALRGVMRAAPGPCAGSGGQRRGKSRKDGAGRTSFSRRASSPG